VATKTVQTSHVSKHVKHNGAAAPSIVQLNVDKLLGRKADIGKPRHEGMILMEENLPDVPLGQVDHTLKQGADVLSVAFVELIDPSIDAQASHWLRSVVVKSPGRSNAVNEL
jgi:hypothetical protein